MGDQNGVFKNCFKQNSILSKSEYLTIVSHLSSHCTSLLHSFVGKKLQILLQQFNYTVVNAW